MTGPDAFGVAVRTIGLLKVLASAGAGGLWFVSGVFGPPGGHWPVLFIAFALLVVGLLLLRSADFVVQFAYPPSWLNPASTRKPETTAG